MQILKFCDTHIECFYVLRGEWKHPEWKIRTIWGVFCGGMFWIFLRWMVWRHIQRMSPLITFHVLHLWRGEKLRKTQSLYSDSVWCVCENDVKHKNLRKFLLFPSKQTALNLFCPSTINFFSLHKLSSLVCVNFHKARISITTAKLNPLQLHKISTWPSVRFFSLKHLFRHESLPFYTPLSRWLDRIFPQNYLFHAIYYSGSHGNVQ